jgi:uncharacterized membrane protein required for colicin V production
MNAITDQATATLSSVRAQSLTAIVGGFSFASAIAWMDAVRWAISQVVKVQRNGGAYYFLTALFTTLLAVLSFTLINTFAEVKKPQQPMYAVR